MLKGSSAGAHIHRIFLAAGVYFTGWSIYFFVMPHFFLLFLCSIEFSQKLFCFFFFTFRHFTQFQTLFLLLMFFRLCTSLIIVTILKMYNDWIILILQYIFSVSIAENYEKSRNNSYSDFFAFDAFWLFYPTCSCLMVFLLRVGCHDSRGGWLSIMCVFCLGRF